MKRMNAVVALIPRLGSRRRDGIKVFSGKGEKFTERLEVEVEDIIHDESWQVTGSAEVPVDTTNVILMLTSSMRSGCSDPLRLGAFKIAFDTANGATTAAVGAEAVQAAWIRCGRAQRGA